MLSVNTRQKLPFILSCLVLVAAAVGFISKQSGPSNYVWIEYRNINNRGGWLGNAAVELHSSEPCFISLTKAGVEVFTEEEGWKVHSETWHGEPRELDSTKPNVFWVEQPNYSIWRAYVFYGTSREAGPAFFDKVREAWKIKSFRNWTAKPGRPKQFFGSTKIVTGAIDGSEPLFPEQRNAPKHLH